MATRDIDLLFDMTLTDSPQSLTFSASSGLPVSITIPSVSSAVCSTDGTNDFMPSS